MEREENMIARVTSAAVLATILAVSAAQAQNVRLTGTIVSADATTLVVKTDKGEEAKVNISDKMPVSAVVKKTVADIKPGNFLGVGAIPQADGSQKAVRINIFPVPNNEGFRPGWDGAPGGTMTNATVDTSVSSVEGQVIMLKYKDGEKKIIVEPNTNIITSVNGDKNDLKPGAKVSVANAVKGANGNYDAPKINVGRDGVTP
jgi:hypothetical protein